jgi:hypothetical protein
MRWNSARVSTAALCSVLLSAVMACEAKKSSNPLSPSVAGPIPGVTISAPVLLQPAQGFKFKESEQPIKLVVQNATTTGVRPLTYTFDVASDNAFTTKVFSRAGVPPGDGGKTTVQIDKLEIGRSYYWRARAEDGANTGTYATAGFEIFPKPAVNPPVAVSPVNNVQVSGTPHLTVHNASFVGPVDRLGYNFQVSTDQGFSQLSAGGIVTEGAGDTTFTTTPLAAGTTYYWRASASDGTTSSAWTATQVFRTAAAPTPSPSPTPTPAPGAPCVSSSPQAIIQCERNKYGHMSPSQTVAFLKAAARSLASNGIPGAPFGILRKSGGTSCDGYSCDIICTGQGTGQKQWDVLGDSDGAQTPSWNGPMTYPNIRVDVCEIQ